MVRAFLHGVHRGVHGCIARDQDEIHSGVEGLGLVQEFEPVDLVHLQVRDHQVDFRFGHDFQSFLAIGGAQYLAVVLAQRIGDVVPGDFLVIHHQHMKLPQAADNTGGQILEHPLLDLGQPEMLVVEDFFRTRNIKVVHRSNVPGQCEQKFQIVQPDGVFGHRGVGFFSSRASSL